MSGVYQTIAEQNPITWMIDGMRYQVIVGFDLERGAPMSIGVAAVLAALAIFGAHRALQARLRSVVVTAVARRRAAARSTLVGAGGARRWRKRSMVGDPADPRGRRAARS